MALTIVITLLVGLLGTFIDWLFKRWLDKTHPETMSLEEAKPFFMQKVKLRVWYGPKRMAIASNLYDKAVARFNSGDPQYAVETSDADPAAAYSNLAQKLTAGLQPDDAVLKLKGKWL